MIADGGSPLRAEEPAIIVGAGPVGATLALELAHHGVRCVVAEVSTAPSRHPKMDFLNGRSMELLGRLGLAGELRRIGVAPDHPFTFLWMRTFAEAPLDRWEYPSVAGLRENMASVNDGSAPREPYQRVLGSLLEALGRRRCHASELVDLREGWAFEGYAEDAEGVAVRLREEATGRRTTVRGSYLVACDGAGSAVRAAAGIPMDELGPSADHCDVYFRSTDPVLGRHGQFFLAVTARGLTLVSRDGDSTWTGTFPLDAPAPFDGDPLAEIRARLGVDLRIDDVLAVAYWRGSLGVARGYRAGRVFLAGDAAHRFFPTGGHGANTGIGDAVDLGWKLAAVSRGWGGPGLLDSYEAERRPVALFNREMCFNLLEVWRRFPALYAGGATSARLAGFLGPEHHQIANLGIHFGYRYASPVICADDTAEPPWDWGRIVATTWPGARMPSVRLSDGTELFDLLGPELTLVDLSGNGAGKPLADEADRLDVPLTHVVIDDDHVRAVCERGLLLVRPDHHVAWRGEEAPADCARVLDRVRGVRC